MKKYIRAMSFTRSQALSKISSLSNTLNEHVMKCVIYQTILPNYMDHWTEEIGIYLYNVNKIKSKTKLKRADYIDSIFASFGTDMEDAEANLRLFKIHNKEYPEFELTDDLIKRLFVTYDSMIELSVPIFVSNETKSISDWIRAVRSILV